MFFRNYRNAQLEFSRSVSPDTMYVPWHLTSRTRWLKSKLNCTVYYEAQTFYLKDIKRRHFWLSYMMDYITFVLAWGDEDEIGFAAHFKMLLVIMGGIVVPFTGILYAREMKRELAKWKVKDGEDTFFATRTVELYWFSSNSLDIPPTHEFNVKEKYKMGTVGCRYCSGLCNRDLSGTTKMMCRNDNCHYDELSPKNYYSTNKGVNT